MKPEIATSQMSRRAFAKLAAVATGWCAAVIRAGHALAGQARNESLPAFHIFIFDPGGADGGCRGCAACRRHAEHKRFASYAAADSRRAHPHCRCEIRAVPASRADYVGLFGEPASEGFRVEQDVRWPIGPHIAPALNPGGLEMPVARAR